jgi:LmbE family N-acetylglucosaminyl deacetylase
MIRFVPDVGDRPLRLLCIGAHSDDLEIGCGGTILATLDSCAVDVTWVVLSAEGSRSDEARQSAAQLLAGAARSNVVVGDFKDCYFQAQYPALKEFFEGLKRDTDPDLVLAHRLDDRHQDHRLVAELTWNTWRNHAVFEYEIPKYEGDLGAPNAYIPLSSEIAAGKVEHLERHFGSQRGKDWFDAATFMGLMRIRGLECRSPSGLAEAFHARKLVISTVRGA